jgi:Lrp/AsnC family transcriptional regulator for asnA, asnC and gidA
MKPKADDLDRAILELLQEDARMSCTEMAQRLGHVSARTVRNRLKKLIDKRIIALSAGAVPESLGFVIAADIYIDVEAGKVSQVADALCKLPEVYYVALVTGDCDISAAVVATDVDSLQTLVNQTFHSIPGVRNTRVYLLTKILKRSYDWPLPEEADQQAGNR